MIARAEALAAERKEQSGFKVDTEEAKRGNNFMQKLQTDAYMGADMNLEDRLNRSRHYHARERDRY